MELRNNICIIGAGPAGLACALQLSRYQYQPLVIEKGQPGGLLKNANHIENYLGFPNGISGNMLVRLFLQQIKKYHIHIIKDTVHQVKFSGEEFSVSCSEHEVLCSKLVVASGTQPNRVFEVPDDLSGKIFYEVYPLLALRKPKIIGIIGAGDAAFDYAIHLAEKKHQVFIFNRTKHIKALPVLQNKLVSQKHIMYYPGYKLLNLSKKGDGIALTFSHLGKNHIFQTDSIIFATGRRACKDFLSSEVRAAEKELIANKRMFFIGDVINQDKRQLSIATGDGIKCAMGLAEILG